LHEPSSVTPNPLTAVRLSLLLAAARLAQRYRQLFPGRAEWLEEVVDWRDETAEEAFAEMVESFLARVEEHLFPVMVDVWDVEVDDALYYLEQIPIIPQGLEHWYYDSFDNYREPLALLLHVEHRYEHDDGGDTLQDAYPDYDFPDGLDLGVVAARLRAMALPDPLSGLLDAIALVRHDCDNVWMDYSVSDLAEMGSDLPWDDAETVAWLTETWQEARPRLERVWVLVDWCSPQQLGPPDGEKLEAVVNLLLQANHMEQTDER
jgi:hypothetical protein